MKLNTVILLTYSLAMIGCASSLKGKSMYPDSSITYRNGYILNKKGESEGIRRKELDLKLIVRQSA